MFCAKECPHSQYIGETKTTLKERFYKHRETIDRHMGTHITDHFNLPGHSKADMRCVPIELNKTGSHNYRKRREKFFMQQLETIWPSGLNSDF